MVRDFVEIRYQESVIFVDADVHLGHPDFFEAQIFQRKGTFVVNVGPRIQQSPAGFLSEGNAFCGAAPFEFDKSLNSKSFRRAREFVLCYERDPLLDGLRCI